MFYYLYLLHDYGTRIDSEILKGFNVFQYITFRALAAGVTAFVLSLVFGNFVIRLLISLKLGQPIRSQEEVHRLHELHGAKAGTPTMGGVLLLGAVLISTFLWARPTNPLVWVALFSVIYLGALGFIDDYLKVTKKSSDGISSRLKFILQCVLAATITIFFVVQPELSEHATRLFVPFAKEPIIQNMGIFTFFLYLFVIVGASNAVNLTDGLDGLAAGCTAVVASAFAVLTYAAGNFKVASYLQITFVPFSGELAVVCMALVGAALGFLWWNCHPARVFMGDTGSLAIGGLLGVLAISCKQELLLALMGGVFVLEAGSVILQVASFKLTGRRIFKMSPLHHHFELSGWKESTVIVRFWILSIVFALLGLATLKLR
ncbi:MAG: phospho-N-acetylmuramoyl-pentapeptide-transferase [Chthoniobacterales bacterium]